MHYIGIDAHKRESQICVLGPDGRKTHRRVTSSRDRIAQEMQKLAPAGSKVLLEASTQSEWIAVLLEELGYEVIVADPNFAPMYGHKSSRQRRIKTDRRDAEALAEAVRIGNYRLAHRTSPQARERRNVLTSRDQLVRMRTGLINTARGLLELHGIRVGKGGSSENFAARVRALVLPAALQGAMEATLTAIDVTTSQVDVLDKLIAQMTSADPQLQRLMTIPGVGPVTAMAFHASIERADRFKNGHKVAAYLGLVPGECSSGDGQRRTSITKTGSSHVRWLLVQAAITLLRIGKNRAPVLHAWAHQIAARRNVKIARIALARRLAGILWAMLRDESKFDPTIHLRRDDATVVAA